MGRRILVQRRGRGGQNFRSPGHWKKGAITHHPFLKEEVKTGKLIDLIHEGGRGMPIGVLDYGNGVKRNWLPPEGVFVGDDFQIGEKTEIKVGNTMCLKNMPEGLLVYNIELQPGDGGKMARAAGAAVTIMERLPDKVKVILPSKKNKYFNPNCRATIGVVSGGGVANKPFLKAGDKYYFIRTKATTWPRVSASQMNTCSHPFGGGAKTTPGRSECTSRDAPPGRKVGMIAARQSGRVVRKKVIQTE